MPTSDDANNRKHADLTDRTDFTDQSESDNPSNLTGSDWPVTLDGAVDRLLGDLSNEDKLRLRAMSKDDLVLVHFNWGMGIRNAFGLWQGNTALLDSCMEASGQTFMDPDEASMVIVQSMWLRLQGE